MFRCIYNDGTLKKAQLRSKIHFKKRFCAKIHFKNRFYGKQNVNLFYISFIVKCFMHQDII